jgi:DNA/RNA endonuclease YhcR with UshA esterase domain
VIERPKLLTIVIAFSLIGVIGLYLYSISLEPKRMAIKDIGEDDIGSLVEVEAYIEDLYVTKNNNLIITLIDRQTNHTLTVFVVSDVYENLNNKEELTPGAEVIVKGEVCEYEGELEIKVTSSNGIRIIIVKD